MAEEFKPKIIAFACNWCAYSAADLAGVSRFQYPPNIRIIRVMCSGRVTPISSSRHFKKAPTGCWLPDDTSAIVITWMVM